MRVSVAGPDARKWSGPVDTGFRRRATGVGEPSPRRPVVPRVLPQAPGPVVLVANPRAIGAVKRDVGADLEVDITAQTTLEIQIAVDYAATHGLRLSAAIVDTQR